LSCPAIGVAIAQQVETAALPTATIRGYRGPISHERHAAVLTVINRPLAQGWRENTATQTGRAAHPAASPKGR